MFELSTAPLKNLLQSQEREEVTAPRKFLQLFLVVKGLCHLVGALTGEQLLHQVPLLFQFVLANTTKCVLELLEEARCAQVALEHDTHEASVAKIPESATL